MSDEKVLDRAEIKEMLDKLDIDWSEVYQIVRLAYCNPIVHAFLKKVVEASGTKVDDIAMVILDKVFGCNK